MQTTHILLAEQTPTGYLLHTFRDNLQARAWCLKEGKFLLKPQQAHGRKYPGQDYEAMGFELSDYEEQIEQKEGTRNMNTTTTTPTQPAPAAKSEALELLKQAMLQIASLSTALAKANDRLIKMEADLFNIQSQLADLTPPAQTYAQHLPAAQASQPTQTGQATETFTMTELKLELTSDGKPTFKALGFPYSKFGVRVWPEILPAIAPEINPASLQPGQKVAVKARAVVAIMGEKGPQKVIGLAQ